MSTQKSYSKIGDIVTIIRSCSITPALCQNSCSSGNGAKACAHCCSGKDLCNSATYVNPTMAVTSLLTAFACAMVWFTS